MRQVLRFLILALPALLAACGGGGSASSANFNGGPSSTRSAAEGLWVEERLTLLVSADSEIWGLEFRDDGPFLVLHHGQMTVSDRSFSASVRSFLGDGVSHSATATGSFIPRTELRATLSVAGSGASSFLTSYDNAYDSPPLALSSLAGVYELYSGGTVDLSSSGVLNGTPGGCLLSGQLLPDPSGKNYYRISLTFGPAPCTMPNSRAEGVLIPDPQFFGVFVGGLISGDRGEVFGMSRQF